MWSYDAEFCKGHDLVLREGQLASSGRAGGQVHDLHIGRRFWGGRHTLLMSRDWLLVEACERPPLCREGCLIHCLFVMGNHCMGLGLGYRRWMRIGHGRVALWPAALRQCGFEACLHMRVDT